MAKKKLLEIGIEGGGAVFFADESTHKITIENTSNDFVTSDHSHRQETYNSLDEAINAFADQNQPILFFYPVYAHQNVFAALIQRLNKEYALLTEQQQAECFNKEEWEELLDTSVDGSSPATPATMQLFEIRPLEKVQDYRYDFPNNEKELEKTVTSWIDVPKQKFQKRGIGEIHNNTFVIRDEQEKILGIYPLDQYYIKPVVG